MTILTQNIGFGAELCGNLFGDTTIATYLSGLFFAGLAILLRKRFLLKTRNVNSAHAPKKTNWRYWLKYNLEPLIYTIVLILVIMRFYPEYAEKYAPEFYAKFPKVTMGAMFIIGLFFDYIVQKIVYAIRSKAYEKNAKIEKGVCYLLESLEDKIIEIDSVSYNLKANELVQKNNLFYIGRGADGKYYLCFKIPSTIPSQSVVGKIERFATKKTVTVATSNWVCDSAGNDCKPV